MNKTYFYKKFGCPTNELFSFNENEFIQKINYFIDLVTDYRLQFHF